MLAALVLGYKKVWVFGWQLVEAEKRCADWQAIAQAALGQNSELIQAAKGHTTLTPEQADMALRIIREAGKARGG